VLVFHSQSVNYDPGGHVSWDFSMTRTDPSWRVAVKPGDTLRIRSAYDASKASWYESMGIIVLFMADGDTSGVDPFRTPVPTTGPVTHGPLPENAPSGGLPTGLASPASLAATQAPADTVHITDFSYIPGGEQLSSPFGDVPTIQQGHQLTFLNQDASAQVFHSITACREPCTATYGNSYPVADGSRDFDSGQLGFGPPGLTAAANRVTWQTPSSLPPGTYTYFCRIHPWMRGAFRVIRG
jgi:plastocyanin